MNKLKLSLKLIFLFLLILLPTFNYAQEKERESIEELISKKLTENIKIEEKGKDIYSLELRNADLKDIIRFFAYQYGLNIIADKDVEGTVTASLGNITIKEALKQILDSQGYTMEEVDTVIRVRKKPTPTENFKLKNISIKDISEQLKTLLSDKGKMVVDEVSNSVTITDNKDNLDMVREFIKNIDFKGKQVLIESKFVETKVGLAEDLGIEWNVVATVRGAKAPHTAPFRKAGQRRYLQNVDATAGESDLTNIAGFPAPEDEEYTFGTLDFSQFQAVLRALLTKTDSKLISNPQVATLNNQKAKIGIATEYPLPKYEINPDTGELIVSGYEYKEIGITLEVTPLITSDDYITMTIEPTVGSAYDVVTVAGTGFELPIVTSKKAITKITVKDGETIVIGGLIENTKSKMEKKVPLLGSIPLLGKVFSYKTDSDTSSELLIFVTPHILNPEGKKELENKKIAQLYKGIEEDLRGERYEQAISKARDILSLRPKEDKATQIIDTTTEKLRIKQQQEEIEANVRKAISLYQERKYNEAKQILEQVLKEQPENEEAKSYLSLCCEAITKEEKLNSLLGEADRLYKNREYESAVKIYSEILKINPEDKSAIKMLELCRAEIEKARKEQINYLLRKGKSAFKKRQYETARVHFNKVLELEPMNKEAGEYIAEIEERKEKEKIVKKAKEPKEEVKKLEPVKPLPAPLQVEEDLKQIFEQAVKMYNEKDYKSAIPLFEQVLIKDPFNQKAYEYIEKCHRELEEKEKEEKKKRISELIEEGKSYLRDGQYDRAFHSFYSVFEIDPKNKAAQRHLAHLKRRISLLGIREAKELTRELSRKESQWLSAELKRAEIYLLEGKFEQAEEIANSILKLQESQRAKEILSEIEKIKLETRVSKEKKEIKKSEARQIYLQAVKLYKEKEYKLALEKFEMLSKQESRYQAKAKSMATKCIEELTISAREKLTEKKYQLAIQYFNMALYQKCLGLLMEVIDLKPDYKEAQKYLRRAQRRLKMLENLSEFEQMKMEVK